MQSMIVNYQFSVIAWFAIGVAATVIYHTLSDQDFSFLLTLGAIVQMCAFLMLLVKTFLEGGADGLSGKTLYLYLLAFLSRLVSTLPFEGYLPYDKTGDWLYQTVEVVTVLFVAVGIYQFHTKASEHARRQDAFLGESVLPHGLNVLFIIVPTAILALIFHPNLNGHFLADYSWTFACYLETFALVPQLVLFQRSGSGSGIRTARVSAYISSWVFALGVGRLLHFFFWWWSHHELNDRDDDSTTVGWLVLLMQLGQIIIMIDFIYHFITSSYKKQPMELPANLSNV